MSKRKVRKPLLSEAQLLAIKVAKAAAGNNDSSDMCRSKPPCGGVCCLSADVPHTLHICHNKQCEKCHGAKRYQGRNF